MSELAKRIAVCCAFVQLLGLLAGCSGNKKAELEEAGARPAADQQLLAEVRAAEAPDGVQSEVWAGLTEELARVLAERGTRRGVSAAATGKGSASGDFWLSSDGGAGANALWSYRNQGDYDLNGEVNISDLTQIGIHFGRSSNGANWQDVQVVDGDGNGEINIGDITPMGQNFGGRVAGYALEFSATEDGPWTVETWLPFIPAAPGSSEYPQYAWHLSTPDPLIYYRVTSTQNDTPAYSFGQPSPAVLWGGVGQTGWIQGGLDAQHTNRSSLNGPGENDLAWEYPVTGISYVLFLIGTSLVSDHFGTTYATTFETPGGFDPANFSDTIGHLYAVDRHGELAFHHIFPIAVLLTPIVLPNQTIVVMDVLGKITCFTRDGKIIWTQQVAGTSGSEISLINLMCTPAGNIYVCDATPVLYKISPNDGSIIWSKPLAAEATATPSLNGNSILVGVEAEGGNPPRVYFFSAVDGAPTGMTNLTNELDRHVMVETGEYVYFTYQEVSVDALPLNLNPPWSYPNANLRTAPSLTWGGERVVGVSVGSDIVLMTGSLVGLDAGGGVLWTRPLSAGPQAEPVVDIADRIYCSAFGAEDSAGIYCINTSHDIEWYHPEPGYMSGVCIAGEGILTYLATDGPVAGLEETQMKIVCLGTP